LFPLKNLGVENAPHECEGLCGRSTRDAEM
jgi:hypothetical protein